MGLSAFNAARARAKAEAEALAKVSVINPKPVEAVSVMEGPSVDESAEKSKKTDAEKLRKGKK